MNKTLFALAVAGLTGLASMAQAADTYTIDPKHSTIGFAVPHLTVSTVKGDFADYQGTIQLDAADPSKIVLDATIQAASIDTRVKDRDTHLRGKDFLDADQFPTITFKSKIVKKMEGGYLVTGDLTIHGVTKSLDLPVKIVGPVTGPMATEVIGLNGTAAINRQEFGVSFNKTMDQGGLMVGDIVTLEINVEAHKINVEPHK